MFVFWFLIVDYYFAAQAAFRGQLARKKKHTQRACVVCSGADVCLQQSRRVNNVTSLPVLSAYEAALAK